MRSDNRNHVRITQKYGRGVGSDPQTINERPPARLSTSVSVRVPLAPSVRYSKRSRSCVPLTWGFGEAASWAEEGWAARTRMGASRWGDRKSTRLNSSHVSSSYAVFCLKKKIPLAEK